MQPKDALCNKDNSIYLFTCGAKKAALKIICKLFLTAKFWCIARAHFTKQIHHTTRLKRRFVNGNQYFIVTVTIHCCVYNF